LAWVDGTKNYAPVRMRTATIIKWQRLVFLFMVFAMPHRTDGFKRCAFVRQAQMTAPHLAIYRQVSKDAVAEFFLHAMTKIAFERF